MLIKRREFITLISAGTAWPLAVRAQQAAIPIVGLLHAGSPEPNTKLVAGFRKGLNETGYIEGRNVAIEYRWAADRDDRLPELAADLVRRKVAVIATPGTTQAARQGRKAAPRSRANISCNRSIAHQCLQHWRRSGGPRARWQLQSPGRQRHGDCQYE